MPPRSAGAWTVLDVRHQDPAGRPSVVLGPLEPGQGTMRSSLRTAGGPAIILSLALFVPPGSALAGQEDVPSGTISIAFESDIRSLDPAIGYDPVSWAAENLLFDQLIGYDEGARLEPRLAAAMPTVSQDGLTYTFTLRQGIPFVDAGDAVRTVTADDVVFSINRLLRPDVLPAPSPVGPSFFSVIEGAEAVLDGSAETATGLRAVDPLTVEITLSRPDRTFLNALAMPFGSIIPAESGYDATAFSAHPVGTGPFWLESYTAGERAGFQHNPHYWRDGLPKAATIDFRVMVPAGEQLLQAQANVLDLMGNDIPAADWGAVIGDPRFKDRVVADPLVVINYLAMDTSGPDSPFRDVRIRRAVNHAIDKENLVRLANGRGIVADCIFPPGLPGSDPTCHPYEQSIEMARALMAEAGSSGFPTQLYTDASDASTLAARSIAADLAQIGIQVEVIAQDFETLTATLRTPHAAPLLYSGWFMDFPDPADFIDPTLSCATAVAGGSNSAWYCNEAVDALSAEARTVVDLDEAIPLYQEIERRIMADAPWVPTFFPLVTALRSERLQGFEHFHPVYWYDLPRYGVLEP
jgi:oligopeptide transport system substrate-binding protein